MDEMTRLILRVPQQLSPFPTRLFLAITRDPNHAQIAHSSLDSDPRFCHRGIASPEQEKPALPESSAPRRRTERGEEVRLCNGQAERIDISAGTACSHFLKVATPHDAGIGGGIKGGLDVCVIEIPCRLVLGRSRRKGTE